MAKSIEKVAEDTDYIVFCTVIDVGESYMSEDVPLPIDNSHSLFEYANKIRTPMEIKINEILYDSTGELGETLTITEKGGTYNGYTLDTGFPKYDVGCDYLLFIVTAPDGETNIIRHQGSAELLSIGDNDFNSSDSATIVPLLNADIFKGLESLDDLRDAIQRAVDNENSMKTLEPQYSIRMYENIDECMKNADYVIACTVAKIGETYLGSQQQIDENDPESICDYIMSIRTPIELSVNEIYYDSTGTLGTSLTLTDYRGTYNGYTLKSPFTEYEVGHEYLLFIGIAPDGKTNIAISQGSAELFSDEADDFNMSDSSTTLVPLFNTDIFKGLESLDDVKNEIQLAIE